jgi:hypothetical protein
MPGIPAYVVDAAYNVLAWNRLATHFIGPMLKHVDHPLAGPLEFECQVLHIAETGQRLIAYCAAPGSATEAAFAELADRAPLPG